MINNKKVLGIIAEYDPFHNGHKLHIDEAIKKSNADYVCIIQSGPFMQRGSLSMFSPHDRAYMSVQNGADIVFEMPVLFSISDAYRFAFGGVSILEKLNFIDFISFACEDNDLETLTKISELLEDNSFHTNVKDYLVDGNSYAFAQGKAIRDALGSKAYDIFCKSNNILAICYLRAIKKLNSKIKPIIIKRKSIHLSNSLNRLSPSATPIRENICSGNIHDAISCIPDKTKKYLLNLILENKINRNELPSDAIMLKAMSANNEILYDLPGVSEGLENKILRELKKSKDYTTLIQNIKSRRYTLSRIKRAMVYLLLEVNKKTLEEYNDPKFCKLLGYSKRGADLLSYPNSNIKIIKKPEDTNEIDYKKDLLAYKIWQITAQYPDYKVFQIKKL